MILTVTLNPSVDISYPLPHLSIDGVNRVSSYLKTSGGKGLNVARVVKQMNRQVAATGFIGGPLGDFIEQDVNKIGIRAGFSRISGETRNCIAILHDEGKQTEILESGPSITSQEAGDFLEQYKKLLVDAEVVVISGSLPKGLDGKYYVKLIELANSHNKKVILDTSGVTLECVLKSETKPFAIKPNSEEIQELVGKKINAKSSTEMIKLLEEPLFGGIEFIMVSMGAAGALVKYQEQYYKANIPKIEVINPVGSGDSTVAGMAIGLAEAKKTEETIKIAMTLGMLNTMESGTGCITVDKYPLYHDQVEVKTLSNN